MSKKQKKLLLRIALSAVLLAAAVAFERLSDFSRYVYLAVFLLPYAVAGYDVVLKSVTNILHGQVFDEAFLMTAATVGALVIGEYPESVFVMLFYQIGELFQSIAVGKSRRSISALMDIRPDGATVIREGEEQQVLPEDVLPGEEIILRPGERVPLDGTVISGESALDQKALTGEAAPVDVKAGDSVISGSVNLSGTLRVRVTSEYGQSTVAKILELVENSSLNKAKSEQFLTRFAKYYTPAVVIAAVLLAVVPSVITGNVSDWVYRALIFLVVSCPCALVISVPLSFFGGIGGASAKGVLIKGANYLEAIGHAKTVVFDKTGTLTSGSFSVRRVIPEDGVTKEKLLSLAASAEYYSNHPIALSLKAAAGECVPVKEAQEAAGLGVRAVSDSGELLAGTAKLMEQNGIEYSPCADSGTKVYVSENKKFLGCIVIGDEIKKGAAEALRRMRDLGVEKTVMLTGDNEKTAAEVAKALGISEFRAGLLPQDKVRIFEELYEQKDKKSTLLFVGDGINDAPVLTRADVGVAMGGVGSDAAIEAADAVVMDDSLSKIADAMEISRRTVKIVKQNVVFALAVKFAVLILAAAGLTSMWLGAVADVGVAVIAILNAMRTLR